MEINIVISDYLTPEEVNKITNRFEYGFTAPKELKVQREVDPRSALIILAANDLNQGIIELHEFYMLVPFIKEERSQTNASNLPLVGRIAAKKLVEKLIVKGYLVKGAKITVNKDLSVYTKKLTPETIENINSIGIEKQDVSISVAELRPDQMTNEEKIQYVYENFSQDSENLQQGFINEKGFDAIYHHPQKLHDLLISTLEVGFDSQYDEIKSKINEEEKKPTVEKYIKEYIRRVYVDMTWKIKISEFGMTVDYTRLNAEPFRKDPKGPMYLEDYVTFDGFFYGRAATLVQLANDYGVRGSSLESILGFLNERGRVETSTHKSRDEMVAKYKEYLKTC